MKSLDDFNEISIIESNSIAKCLNSFERKHYAILDMEMEKIYK